MKKAKLENGAVVKYPYRLHDLKKDNPNTTFDPDSIPWESFGAFDVAESNKPIAGVVTESVPVFVNGVLTQSWEGRDYDANELAEQRDEKRHAIDDEFSKLIAGIKAGYSPDEIQSWPQQERQAQEWSANNAAPALLLRAMAAGRGVPINILVDKILINSAAYSQLYGGALGECQRRTLELAAINIDNPEQSAAQIKAAIDAV